MKQMMEVIFMRRLLAVLRGDTGASLMEYALIAALVVIVAVGALTVLGRNVSNKINNVANAIGG